MDPFVTKIYNFLELQNVSSDNILIQVVQIPDTPRDLKSISDMLDLNGSNLENKLSQMGYTREGNIYIRRVRKPENLQEIILHLPSEREEYIALLQGYNASIVGSTQTLRTRLINILNVNGYLRDLKDPDIFYKYKIQKEFPEIIPNSYLNNKTAMKTFIKEYGLESHSSNIKEYLISKGYIYDRLKGLVQSGIELKPNVIVPFVSLSDVITEQDILHVMSTDITLNREIINALSVPETVLPQGTFLDRLMNLPVPRDISRFVCVVASLKNINPNIINQAYSSLTQNNIASYNERIAYFERRLSNKIHLVPFTYPIRQSFPSGQMPTNLYEALKQGYDITNNRTLLSEFANTLNMNMDNRYVLHFAKLLYNYPDLVLGYIQYIGKPRNLLITETIKLVYSGNTNRVQEIYTYLTLDKLMINYDERRVKILNSFSDSYLKVLFKLYDKNSLNEIIDSEINPLEPYIIEIGKSDNETIPEIVKNFGMIIPNIPNKKHYALINLANYKHILNRPKNTPSIQESIKYNLGNLRLFVESSKFYTDKELMDYANYTGSYTSRLDLVNNIFNHLTKSHFFLLNKFDPERVVNQYTAYGDALDELTPPYLAYGTGLQYRIYLIEELNGSFSGPEENPEFITFKHPENLGLIYTSSEILTLQDILENLTTDVSIELANKIYQGMIYIQAQDRNTLQLKELLNNISEDDKAIIKSIFEKIFYAGMYMRRWEGPGNPYPMHLRETISKIDPDIMTIPTLESMWKEFNKLNSEIKSSIMELNAVNIHENNVFKLTEYRLFPYLQSVSEGRYCIRMASMIVVVSSYYYLYVFFKHIIPNFKLSLIEAIE